MGNGIHTDVTDYSCSKAQTLSSLKSFMQERFPQGLALPVLASPKALAFGRSSAFTVLTLKPGRHRNFHFPASLSCCLSCWLTLAPVFPLLLLTAACLANCLFLRFILSAMNLQRTFESQQNQETDHALIFDRSSDGVKKEHDHQRYSTPIHFYGQILTKRKEINSQSSENA